MPAVRLIGVVALLVGLSGCGAPPTSEPTTERPATAPPGATSAATSAEAPAPGRWVPPGQVSWQWQLSGPLDLEVDAAVNEQCAQYDECERLLPFVRAGKPVLHAEYELEPSAFCDEVRALGFSSIRKSLDLDAQRTAC
ncbi:endo alpha-1,4 polygalactosaminidase [Pengzhenrongella sp.]|jgi:hypothetical protein|uniref:endo alpha-1,4 polygalactosaminidase n=1 Tax=Pengzhenrongella sp. TaxID=2888820 RepID=UPI002F926E94